MCVRVKIRNENLTNAKENTEEEVPGMTHCGVTVVPIRGPRVSRSQIRIMCSHLPQSFLSHKPGDDRLCGLQLLQRHGDSHLGFGVRGQLVQGYSCRWHGRVPQLYVTDHQLPDHYAEMW